MTLRNARPIRFSPAGLSDSLDATDLFPGACAVLQDLIPDPTTKDIWTCRPASDLLTSFAGFMVPGTVSVFQVVGSLVYGMVASALNAGFDEPFVYDLSASAFVTLTGVVSSNVPFTQPTTGEWVPPTMDLAGVRMIVTHPGFNGTSNYFGWFNTSDPTAPTWHAGNTTGAIILSTVPAWVAQVNGRAWFGINPPTGQPSAVFTDSLALSVTNSNQALTFGDNVPLTAARGLPLNNQLGGVIQALLVFKGVENIVQITGDAATNNLATNTLNEATGTNSPRTICQTPQGIAFIAPDGLRLIDFNAHVSEPIGVAGSGVNKPFLKLIYPSRACAACNADVIRISIQPVTAPQVGVQEYWFDLVRKVWSGPHTFPSTMIGVYGISFILAPVGVPAKLFSGSVVPELNSSETENGKALSWAFQTVVLQDNLQMAMSEITEMQVKTSGYGGSLINVSIVNENGNALPYGITTYTYPTSGTLWGQFRWGHANWASSAGALRAREISFPGPVIFARAAVKISGVSVKGFQIGDIFMRTRYLGYMQETA